MRNFRKKCQAMRASTISGGSCGVFAKDESDVVHGSQSISCSCGESEPVKGTMTFVVNRAFETSVRAT